MECKESLRKIIEDIESYVSNNNIEFPYNIENILNNLEKIDSKYATLSFLSSTKDFLHIGFLRQSTKTRMLLIYFGMQLN